MMNRRKAEALRELRAAESARVRGGVRPSVAPLARVTVGGGTTGPVAKPEPYRDPVLLEMARGRPCLLCPPLQCICTPGSVVACHSNLPEHGKGMSRKADDCYSVWGGDKAHYRLDRSGAARETKELMFMGAHILQVAAWRLIATDPTEPERFRKAARRALERLNATHLGDME